MSFRNFLLLTALLFGPSTLVAQAAPGLPATEPILKPGDKLRITIWHDTEYSGEFLISEKGTLAHPRLKNVVVTGIPMSEVETRIREFLAQYNTDPQFVLQPLIRVLVTGAVESPNLYLWSPETTIGQGIWLAGGPASRANLSKVSVIRDGQETILDIKNLTGPGATTQVRSGDQIIVARNARSWREYLSIVGNFASLALLAIRIREKI
jgi:polysaccharide export outer membrane protein